MTFIETRSLSEFPNVEQLRNTMASDNVSKIEKVLETIAKAASNGCYLCHIPRDEMPDEVINTLEEKRYHVSYVSLSKCYMINWKK